MQLSNIFGRNQSKRELQPNDLLVMAASGSSRMQTTSYTASGHAEVPSNATVELGSSVGGITRETIPQLTSPVGAIRIYDAMADNDAAVDMSLRAAKTPILGATYFVQAADDTQEALDIAEFCEYNLLNGQSAPFLNVLEDILRMYEYGASVLEKVWTQGEWAPTRTGANRKNYTMLSKLAARPTPNVMKFYYDDFGGPNSIDYMAIRADNKPEKVNIPVDKLVIFTNNRKGGNLQGKSILRTAYKHWYYKDNLYKIDGIQKERHGMGFPIGRLPLGYTDADKVALQSLIKNIRTNEEGGAVLPQGFDIEFAEMKGQPVNIMESIDHHNGMIMLNVMVQFLLLGLSAGGGRATSGSQQDMFTKSLRYIGNLICQQINLYVIPQLVGYNFDTKQYPTLRVRNIGETKDLQQWASAMANLVARNLITVDLETEQWVREVADAPYKLGGKQTPEANSTMTGGFGNKGDVQPTNQDAGGTGRTGADPSNGGG